MTQPPGLVREALTLHVSFPDGSTADLEALLTRPAAPGRFPVAMINHGFPRDVMLIPRMTPETYSAASIAFARRGYAAVVVNRRGFGLSSGAADMAASPCNARNYAREGRVSADDIRAALTVLRQEPWADPRRIVLVGHSAGGLGVIAAAAEPMAGVLGVINFAGGRGSSRADFVCNAEGLVRTMHDFGAQTRLRSLWIYAENDHFFGPAIAQQMFAAYREAGAPGEFIAAPAYEKDGHMLFSAGDERSWWGYLAPFLSALGLPTQPIVEVSVASLPAPRGAAANVSAGFTRYLASRGYEKAFAVSKDGHFGFATGRRSEEDAGTAALTFCSEHGTDCAVYAVGDRLAKP